MLSPAIVISLLYIGHVVCSPNQQQINHHVAQQSQRIPRHWFDHRDRSDPIDGDSEITASGNSLSFLTNNKTTDDLDFVTTFSGNLDLLAKLDKATADRVDDEFDRIELHTNNHKSPAIGSQLSPAQGFLANTGANQHSRHYSAYSPSIHHNHNHLYHQQQSHLSPTANIIYNKKHAVYSAAPSAYSASNLNYIHGLLQNKPSTLSSLLNFNSNSLSTQSTYGLPLQGNLVSPFYSTSMGSPQGSSTGHQQQHFEAESLVPSSTQVSPRAEHEPQASAHQSFNLGSTSSFSNEIDTNSLQNFSLNPLDQQQQPADPLFCGKQQVGIREPRIVGGNSTYEGEFPWAVSIQRQGNHHCGGVIVGRRWILTAAHCVRSQLVGNLLVRTGGHTLTRSSNSLNSHLSRDYLVEQIVMHDDFSRYDNLTSSQMKSSANTNNADIALLRLKQEINWNELAWPVCFPSKDSGNFSGRDAVVIGWGKLNEKSEDFSSDLQKVKLTIIDNKVCQNWFRQAGRDMPIDERIICAGFKNGGKDACHGDSGGPLLSKINGQYVVVGVVSTGIGCARPLLPGLYSRVSSYLTWIERHIAN